LGPQVRTAAGSGVQIEVTTAPAFAIELGGSGIALLTVVAETVDELAGLPGQDAVLLGKLADLVALVAGNALTPTFALSSAIVASPIRS
jgi:hypothetical protein